MVLIDILATIFMGAGILFMFVGTIGLLRFPDFYTRLHATGKCDTLGEGLILLGLMIYHLYYYSETLLVPIKLFFLILFIFVANPAATHAIMKAAYLTGLKPWKLGDKRQ